MEPRPKGIFLPREKRAEDFIPGTGLTLHHPCERQETQSVRPERQGGRGSRLQGIRTVTLLINRGFFAQTSDHFGSIWMTMCQPHASD